MKYIKLCGSVSCICLAIAAMTSMASVAFASVPALIPMPREMKLTGGSVALAAADSLKVEVVASIPPEGYELSITKDGVTIRHSDDTGLFYAKMTLKQLKDAGGSQSSATEKADAMNCVLPGLPCLEIKDSPAFRWRGVQLGETQRVFGKNAIKRILNLMARYKFNVFHWHFTDDRGWRIDFPEYPELARKSARPGLCANEQALFYSKEDVCEILDYAKARHITVVPEVDFPGHCGAVAAAHPEFTCKVGGKKRPNVLCVGNPDAVAFAEKALDWACELFPDVPIHIGGDECSRKFWAKCPKCRAFMKREGLKSTGDIQPWLTRRLVEHLAAKGRRAIGWEEVVVGFGKIDANGESENDQPVTTALLPDKAATIVMGYHAKPAALCANMGYDVVACPNWHCYFDYSQRLPEDPYKYHAPDIRWCPFENAYSFDPFEGVAESNRVHVVGGECCNWTGKTFCVRELEWKMWPRSLATAEVLWTNPDPKKRDFAEFSARAAEHRRRLIREGVNCAPMK